jgi:hypothetical protein
MTDQIDRYIVKHPSASLLYDFEFKDMLGTANLSSGESVSQVAKLGRVSGSGNLTITTVNRSGTIVQCRIAGGTANEDYRVRATCVDSIGNTLPIDVIVQCREATFEE